LFNTSWLLVFMAGLVFMAASLAGLVFMEASFTPIFCLLGVLGPTSTTIGPGFLPGLARLFLQHYFSRN
jgi:hypothetical protein